MSIATELTRLQTAKANLKTSIEAKGVTVASDATLDAYPALVDSIPSGGGSNDKSIEFIDYDGTVLYSYTPTEFLALEAMPAPPTKAWAASSSWNWDLTYAKAEVTACPAMTIGAVYMPTVAPNAGAFVRFGIDILDSSNLTLTLYLTRSGAIRVDWGDSTIEDIPYSSGSDNIAHTYSSIGYYEVMITSDFLITLGQYSAYVFAGSHRTHIKNFTFNGDYVAFNEYALAFSNINAIIFGECRNNDKVKESLLRYSKVRKVSINRGCEAINSYAFSSTFNLKRIVIPSRVTDIKSNAFTYSGISECYIASTNTTIYNSAFSYNYLDVFFIREDATSITLQQNALYNFGIERLKLPGVQIMSASVFNSTYGTKEVVVNKLTLINGSSFDNCINKFYLLVDAVPTMGNPKNFPTSTIIYVLPEMVDDFKNDSTWGQFASRIYASPYTFDEL